MSIPSNPQLLLNNRVIQAILYLREYRIIADQVLEMINASALTGLYLIDKLNAAVQVRDKLSESILGKQNEAVRMDLSRQFSININKELVDVKRVSEAMLKDMSDLLSLITFKGQIVNANDNIGRVDAGITAPDSDKLKSSIIDLQLVIDYYQ